MRLVHRRSRTPSAAALAASRRRYSRVPISTSPPWSARHESSKAWGQTGDRETGPLFPGLSARWNRLTELRATSRPRPRRARNSASCAHHRACWRRERGGVFCRPKAVGSTSIGGPASLPPSSAPRAIARRPGNLLTPRLRVHIPRNILAQARGPAHGPFVLPDWRHRPRQLSVVPATSF